MEGKYCCGYSDDVDVIRDREYPLLKDTIYLDHAGTTLYAKSLIESFSHDLTSNLFGNPHSASASSQLSTRRIDDIRLRALRFFNADPDKFDLVFVANATAAIKLAAEVVRDSSPHGFWYAYHSDAHTSLVGVRELAGAGNRCLRTDAEVDAWIPEIAAGQDDDVPKLFAYPAQSNMNGRRLPTRWCGDIRRASNDQHRVFTLLDAASLVSTAPLQLGDASSAPDFTALSFYKVFGFPDLGALIVRKDAGHVLAQRKYFGGGTVDMVLTREIQWHAKKASSIHGLLEDGTLPFHSIVALASAFDIHERLYGSMENISSHTRFLACRLYNRLSSLTHPNGTKVCQFYMSPGSHYNNRRTQGPIVSFNLRSSDGAWIGKTEVEKLANVKEIQIRSGSLCNPGGTASSLGWTGAVLRRLHSSGLRCGDDHDIMDGRPTGVLRVSLGAMTSIKDIDTFVAFVDEFYVEKSVDFSALTLSSPQLQQQIPPSFSVESISVYPIKSCGAFKVPDGQRWEVTPEGLAWDREWCLVHQGTGTALSQKKYPRMALIRPFIDLDKQVLSISCPASPKSLEIPLVNDDANATNSLPDSLCQQAAMVCGSQVVLQAYSSSRVSAFFSDFLGVPCTLARLSSQPSASTQFFNPSLYTMPGSFPTPTPTPTSTSTSTPRRSSLSNESPILVISRSSVNRLNDTIKASPTGSSKAIAADVFRSNVVVAETTTTNPRASVEQPYIEDSWTSLSIGPDQLCFDVLGSCQRCQMVCIDQATGVRDDEPLSTLAKTRRFSGKTYFGMHAGLVDGVGGVMVGDDVVSSNM